MTLTPDQFRRVETLFHELFDQAKPQRSARLREIAAVDPAVAAEVERMLADEVRSAAATEHLDPVRGGLEPDAQDPPHPRRIGRYTIERLAGEGGMGRVYEATQQEPVKRRVAIKLMRDGFATSAARARFRAEQQALAVMDHPGIASVHDADVTDDGFPYFVMEWVDGEPLTAYCDREELDLDQRLDLFCQVLDAVRHAHQKGIIHRDLKPSNILVTPVMSDESEASVPSTATRARVKVIDFGIAKAVGEPMMSGTHGTRVGDLLGTPEYMSPEQAALGATDIDVRSDVYSLGLLLFELLTGDLPISRAELRRIGFDEMRRYVMEVEAPRPSERIRTTAATAGTRWTSAEATTLARRVRGDLDWIVLKALAKERDRRYDSVTGFFDDLRRHRNDQPVSAGPPTLRYRAAKFVRRNRLAVVAGAALALAIVAGLVGTTYGLVEARRATERTQQALDDARLERATAQRVADFLRDLFRSADPREQAGRDLTVDEVLQRGAASIDQLDAEPRIQLSLLGLFGDIYRSQDQMDRAEEFLQRVIEFDHPEVDQQTLLRERALARARFGGLLRDRGQFEEARAILAEGLEEAEAVLGPTNDVLGSLHNNLGTVLRRLNRYEDARFHYQRALDAAEANEDPPGPNVATVVNNLASVDHFLGRYETAADHTRRAITLFETVIPETHPYFGTLYQNLSAILRNLPDLPASLDAAQRSVTIMRTALGPDHSNLAGALVNQGWVERNLGRLDAARSSTSEAVAILERTIGLDNHTAAPILARHASVLYQLGQLDPAESALRRALSVYAFDRPEAQQLEDLNGLTGYARDLSVLLRQQGRTEDAALVTEQALIASATFENELVHAEQRLRDLIQPAVAALLLEQGLLALAAGRPSDADRLYVEALDRAGCSPDRECTLDSTEAPIQRAGFLAQRGRSEDALEAIEFWFARDERVWWATESPDLDPLRGLAEFAELRRRWHRLIEQRSGE